MVRAVVLTEKSDMSFSAALTATPAQPTLSLRQLVLLALLTGINLRPALAAVGPLADIIRLHTSMSFALMSLLTLLPVLAMGLGCFAALYLRRHFSLYQLVLWSLLLLVVANLIRRFDSGAANTLLLLLSSLLAGAGIAVIQASLPVLIKNRAGQRTPLVMGLYVSAIMAGAALAASVTPLLQQALSDWRLALASWSLPALVAAIGWYSLRRRFQQPLAAQTVSLSPALKYSRLLSLITFFALAGAGYVCILAWLPPFLLDLGVAPIQAGYWLAYLTAVEVLAGLLFPAWAARHDDRRRVLFTVVGLSAAGFIWLALLTDTTTLLIPMTLLGLGIGGQFPLVMIVTMDHHNDADKAGSLISVVQGVGYSLAAFTPLAMGLVRDQLGSFSHSWLVLALIYLLLATLICRYNPAGYAGLRRQ